MIQNSCDFYLGSPKSKNWKKSDDRKQITIKFAYRRSTVLSGASNFHPPDTGRQLNIQKTFKDVSWTSYVRVGFVCFVQEEYYSTQPPPQCFSIALTFFPGPAMQKWLALISAYDMT